MTSQLSLPDTGDIIRSAAFSPCMTWRYTLVREWDKSLPVVTFVLLNPSTADEHQDDPTNRRGIAFARRWGCGTVVFVNLFAYRTPDPKEMKAAHEPVGPENDRHILEQVERSNMAVAAWGVHGIHHGRDKQVLDLLNHWPLLCFGTTKEGHPKHPLYIRADQPLITFKESEDTDRPE